MTSTAPRASNEWYDEGLEQAAAIAFRRADTLRGENAAMAALAAGIGAEIRLRMITPRAAIEGGLEERARELLAAEFDSEGVSPGWARDVREKPIGELCWSEQAALRAIKAALSSVPERDERLDYERRILAAECGTQRILNALETKLRWFADQARTNRDAMDPKAAEILSNIANMVHEIDVTAKEPLIDITKAMRAIRRSYALGNQEGKA